MRTVTSVSLAAFAAVLLLATSGCAGKNGKNITPIPGARSAAPGADSGAPMKTSGSTGGSSVGDSGAIKPAPAPESAPVNLPPGAPIGLGGGDPEFPDFNKDAVMFSGNTVFFDFDKAAIKKSEQKKIDEVASYLKGSGAAANKMLVEGHCDERGTEEYNRALGERRALAIREYLVRAGVGADRVYTRSYGEDRPADTGHNEAAWSKNRRGEFVVLKPKSLN